MRVIHLNEGPKAEFHLDGTVLTIQGVQIDLAVRQKDTETVVTVSLDRDLKTAVEGVGAWYVATIVIPPRAYKTVETTGPDGQPAQELQPLPLDLDQVELRLWALPNQ